MPPGHPCAKKAVEHDFPVPAGVRDRKLVNLLALRLSLSRRQAKTILDQRRVLVNGRRVWMARHEVRPGDRVCIQRAEEPPEHKPLDVLFRDGDYLVADKPPGLLSNGPDSLETRLRSALDEPGLRAAHRLDRDTSGCLLFALHDEAFERILKLFREQKIDKRYLAVADGRVAFEGRTFTAPLDGRTARTETRVLDRTSRASLLDVRIGSGRTHQVRRHLAAAGHPLLGDKVYAGNRPADAAVTRQLLHAARISFRSPLGGKEISAHAPLPTDFRAALRRLGLQSGPRKKSAGKPVPEKRPARGQPAASRKNIARK